MNKIRITKRQRILKGQIKMDSLEKLLNKGYTRRRQTKQKHNTICVRHHYTQHTNNINKT